MRQPTLDEAARIIDAGDAMAEELRALLAATTHVPFTRFPEGVVELLDAWRDATREVAP